MSSVRVAVRVRPLNKREKQLSSKSIIHMQGNATSILKPSFVRGEKLKDRGKTFSFDFSYDSSDRGSSTFASQQRIFQDLGSDVLKAAFEGFNACVFTYGQTGSGKSYTMMGLKDDKGLIPRICEGLFLEISNRGSRDGVSFHTEVSYLEIYNERVLDLLKKRAPSTEGGGLRVREHPRDGAYVENLSKHLVQNHSDMEDLIIFGNANRTTASTGMNDFSSRSHAIFTITFIQAQFDAEFPSETVSKIHLVDLAGSERAASTCTTGTRLKEGANINKSLVTLGSVISALADLSVGGQSTKKKQIFIPYRDSVLTWLLKDSLGGNARTTMIATISPADVNYTETLSTLRYASRAKNIVNSPTVNEDGSVKVIRELQAEVTRLRRLLEEATQVSLREPSSSVMVKKKLRQNEAKVAALAREWTSKWEEAESVLQEEETVALRKEGSAVVLDCQLPHLIGIDEDLLSTGITLYYLKEGRTLIGSRSCDIVLHGPGLLSEHCVLQNHAGTVTLFPQEGALCSINGCLATDPCQLTQGAVIQLGTGITLRFNHPTEASQLREKCQRKGRNPDGQYLQTSAAHTKTIYTDKYLSEWELQCTISDFLYRKSEQLSAFSLPLTDLSTSKVKLHNPGPRSVEEKLSQQEVGLQQVSESQNRCNWGIKTIQSSGTPHQWRAERKTKVADGLCSQVNGLTADTCQCKETTQAFMTTAIPGKYPVPQTSFELDRGTLQGGVSTGDGQEQERDLCHKSGPGLISERPQRKAHSKDGAASYKAEEVWPGDASLQQTSVLGPGDGCGVKPEGNANEIQGVVTDCYKGRPGSGGNSLGSSSHLQSSGGSSSTSVLPQTKACSQLNRKTLCSQTPRCLPKEPTFQGQLSCGGMDEAGGLKEIPGVCVTETAEAPFQKSGLSSLFSKVSWFVQDAGRLLWRSPTVLQQVTEVRLQPIRARWSSHVVSLVRESNVLSVVKDSQVFSMVRGSFFFSLIKDSHIVSMVKELPLIQHIQMEITQQLQPAEAAQMIQGCINPENTPLPLLTPTQTFSKAEELPDDVQLVPEAIWKRTGGVQDLQSPHKCNTADVQIKQGQQLPLKPHDDTKVSPEGRDQQSKKSVCSVIQTLIQFPDSLSKLQTLPLSDMMEALQSVISTSVITSQKIVSLHWLNVAKCTQPEPQPALLILMESALYTLTTDSGLLVLFHHLPLLQLKEIQIGLAGHSLRLMGTSEESILGVYTHSQEHSKELCRAILGVMFPGNSRVYQHPLLHDNLMKLSLDWWGSVPDLVLDAGLKVCSQFQKSLAELVYLLHCNVDQETVALGEAAVLLYTSVAVCISSSTHSEHVAQFLLTDTHFGVVKEDVVFYPTPRSTTVIPCRPQFRDLTLRQCSDVRCMLLHDEDKSGSVRLDVILANVKGRGHPETVAEAAGPSAHALNSSPHAEVWKLTFSCSAEAACLINHLSNV